MRILVGVDGSVRSERALRWALREARARNADVSVVHAFDVPSLRGPLDREVPLDDEHARAREHVDRMVARSGRRAAAVPVDVEVVATTDHRTPANVLLGRSRHADLVVVGARGLGGFAGLLLGSVSQQVAAHANVPVAVIPGPAAPGGASIALPRSVVVGVDGSSHAAAALRWAVDHAAVHVRPVTAVYVHPPVPATLTAGIASGVEHAAVDRLWTHGHAEAQQALEDLVAKATAGVEVTVDAVAISGSAPAHRLLEYAAGHDGLLVVGSRGRGGFPGLLLGSVSMQCLHHGALPVVVVHG
ncbi:MAG TPA: universal stress protein [Euzebyales bacterium]|nr:universal stress protein [Euzebyales bacterium]